MRIIQAIGSYLMIIGQLFSSLWHLKRWWATPLVFVLVLFGVLFLLASSSAIAPFIYTLF